MEREAVGYLGYTFIEVMIVLAITAAIFASAVTIFGSQRGSTDFSQSMQDLNSKIQSYANRVQTSTYTGSDGYTCAVSADRAQLTQGGTNGMDCIFLGLAIQAFPGQKSVQAYTVLGTKDIWSGGDTGNPAMSIDGPSGANPAPAILISAGNPSYVLTDSYQLGAGSIIKSSKSSSNDYDLVGFYNGLPNDTVANSKGTGALVIVGYPCNTNDCLESTPGTGQLRNCIEETASCISPPRISQWNVCVQDGHSSNTALLTVNSAPGGITAQLNFVSC